MPDTVFYTEDSSWTIVFRAALTRDQTLRVGWVLFVGITTCSKGSTEHTSQFEPYAEGSKEPLEGLKQGSNTLELMSVGQTKEEPGL